jgi:DNA modification methylase
VTPVTQTETPVTVTELTPLTTAYTGEVTAVLRGLPAQSVHSCVTSPPYFGLRSYLPVGHPLKAAEIGTEKTPQEYVDKLVGVFRELRRVLRDDGSFWLNLGDSYAANRSYQCPSTKGGPKHSPAQGFADSSMRVPTGMKAKDLMGIPWTVAFALRDDGWYLRSGCPWVKRNAMPSSVEDRPGSSLEYVFLLAKSPDYFYDREAVKRQANYDGPPKPGQKIYRDGERMRNGLDGSSLGTSSKTRNRRDGDWWFESVGMLLANDGDEILGFDVTPTSYKGAHFACFPPKLVEPCVLAGTSAVGVCGDCGEPWRRVVSKERTPTRPGADTKVTGDAAVDGNRDPQRHVTTTRTVGWAKDCACESETVPATVLDPFGGSGTTASVCQQHGRRCILVDINADYLPLQRQRTAV